MSLKEWSLKEFIKQRLLTSDMKKIKGKQKNYWTHKISTSTSDKLQMDVIFIVDLVTRS